MKASAATTACIAALSIVLLASPAEAQPAALERDPAKAETLFRSAKALLDQGDWAAACPKLQASMELDPAVSTQLKIARCHEHDGKLALAWNDVSEALKLNKTLPQPEQRRAELDAYARKLLDELSKRVPRLRIHAASVPADLHVTQDGRPLPVAALGEALPADPGDHEIVAEAPGFAPFRKSVTLVEGQSLAVDLTLAVLPPPPPPPEEPHAGPVSEPRAALPPPLPAVPADPGKTRRVAGISVGAFGVASLAGSLALGILTERWVSAATPFCEPGFASCQQHGLDLLSQARGMQTGAFVLLATGVAATATGIALFATAPRAKPGAPAKPEIGVAAGPSGVTLRGAW